MRSKSLSAWAGWLKDCRSQCEWSLTLFNQQFYKFCAGFFFVLPQWPAFCLRDANITENQKVRGGKCGRNDNKAVSETRGTSACVFFSVICHLKDHKVVQAVLQNRPVLFHQPHESHGKVLLALVLGWWGRDGEKRRIREQIRQGLGTSWWKDCWFVSLIVA